MENFRILDICFNNKIPNELIKHINKYGYSILSDYDYFKLKEVLKLTDEEIGIVNNIKSFSNKVVFDREIKRIRCHSDIYYLEAKELMFSKQEVLKVVSLDHKLNIISSQKLTIGTNDRTVISPTLVFREALLNNASSIIMIHNHPSGDANPSKQDEVTTKEIEELGEKLDIPLLDHIIVGRGEYYSIRENQIFKDIKYKKEKRLEMEKE